MELYTREGDSGRSGTRNRRSIPKDSPVFELLGTLEECVGLLEVAEHKLPQALVPIAGELQENLRSLAAEMAGEARFATAERVTRLERAIDSLTEQPLFREPAPGRIGEGGAAMDVARAVARRAERKAVAMAVTGGVTRDAIAWLNRVSDLMEAVARLSDRTQPVSPSPGTAAAAGGSGLCARASGLCSAVIARAREQGIRVVAAVCDGGGNLVCLMRDDGALLASIDVAMGKAYTSAALGMDTRRVGELTQPGAQFWGLQQTNQGRIVPFGGGVPLTEDGQLIGALGVSGASADEDAALAQWGAENF